MQTETEPELWKPSGHRCAVSCCHEMAVKGLRINQATVMPICEKHETQRKLETLRDGDCIFTVDRSRLAFLPE